MSINNYHVWNPKTWEDFVFEWNKGNCKVDHSGVGYRKITEPYALKVERRPESKKNSVLGCRHWHSSRHIHYY